MNYRIENGAISYGVETILEEINFEINEKDKIAIVGRNGAGKTTLLKAIVDNSMLEEGVGSSKFGVYKQGNPVIGYLKQIDFESYPSSLLKIAIQKNIKLIAMHTNFDKTHFGKYVVRKLLKIDSFNQDGFVVYFSWDSNLDSLCYKLKESLKIQTLKITKSSQNCKNIALVTGSGASFVRSLSNVDCLITGDIKYHEAMEAMERNINLIDCGHYELECYFGEILADILTNYGYKAIILDSKNPFYFL